MKNNVRRFRRELEMSQEELASLAGVGRHTIMYVESNRQEPSATIAYKIARALRKDPLEVFPLDESVNSMQREGVN